MSAFVNFMASSTGRIVRVVAGIILIALGLLAVQGVGTWILVIVGLVVLAAGALDICIFAPLASLPFSGKQIRGE